MLKLTEDKRCCFRILSSALLIFQENRFDIFVVLTVIVIPDGYRRAGQMNLVKFCMKHNEILS